MKYALILSLCFTPVLLFAQFKSSGTYQGTPITKDTILPLSPQTPSALQEKVDQFLLQNPELARFASGAEYYKKIPGQQVAPFLLTHAHTPELLADYFEPAKKALARSGVATEYPWLNMIIPLDEQWLIKASGLANRRQNIKAYLNIPYNDPLTPADLKLFKQKVGETFQTISRMRYWLRAQEAVERFGLDRIGIHRKYLVHIPGRPIDVSDTNYVIVTEKIAHPQNILDTQLLEDPVVIQQLARLIGYTGLWDINENNLVVADNKVYVIDTEQPNRHRPDEFFHKNSDVFRSNVEHGWGELKTNLIQRYGEKHSKDVTQLLQLADEVAALIKHDWQ